MPWSLPGKRAVTLCFFTSIWLAPLALKVIQPDSGLARVPGPNFRILSLPGGPMSQTIEHPELSAAEWKLIQELRQLPDERLRSRVHTSLQELLYFFQNPRCEGMGIEGFPCGEPRSSCEDCHQIWETLDRVAERSAKGKPLDCK